MSIGDERSAYRRGDNVELDQAPSTCPSCEARDQDAEPTRLEDIRMPQPPLIRFEWQKRAEVAESRLAKAEEAMRKALDDLDAIMVRLGQSHRGESIDDTTASRAWDDADEAACFLRAALTDPKAQGEG